MTHPLTDEMMEAIHGNRPGYSNPFDEDDMRAAAHWQLERNAEYCTIALNTAQFIPPQTVDYIIEEFKQAMRPQEDNQ